MAHLSEFPGITQICFMCYVLEQHKNEREREKGCEFPKIQFSMRLMTTRKPIVETKKEMEKKTDVEKEKHILILGIRKGKCRREKMKGRNTKIHRL